MICGFLGHKNTPSDILPILEQAIKNIIIQNNYVIFYVGNQGKFDGMVYTTLKKYAGIYQNFSYYVVLAYLPNNKLFNDYYGSTHTIFPDGIESIMPKYAISYRNK